MRSISSSQPAPVIANWLSAIASARHCDSVRPLNSIVGTSVRPSFRAARRRACPAIGALQTGSDQIQATAIVNGATVPSNLVTLPWNSGTNQAPVVIAGGTQTVTLPAQAVLTGTVTADTAAQP